VTLAETQALFGEAVAGGAPIPAGRIEACFVGTPGLPAADRVAIYADMYLGRLVDALAETFPDLARHLGHEELHALAADYLARHPSGHHDIGQVGRHLAAFLGEHPDPERPWLADLAALEWARQEAFFAPAAQPAGPGVFAALAPGEVAGARLALSPALRLVRLGHDVTPLWRQLEAGQAPEAPPPGPAAVAAWRPGFEVVHGLLPLDEAAALEAALAGAPLSEVCAAFEDRDDPAAAAHAALSSWLSEGWVVGVRA
jgi:hypothetical protein